MFSIMTPHNVITFRVVVPLSGESTGGFTSQKVDNADFLNC